MSTCTLLPNLHTQSHSHTHTTTAVTPAARTGRQEAVCPCPGCCVFPGSERLCVLFGPAQLKHSTDVCFCEQFLLVFNNWGLSEHYKKSLRNHICLHSDHCFFWDSWLWTDVWTVLKSANRKSLDEINTRTGAHCWMVVSKHLLRF